MKKRMITMIAAALIAALATGCAGKEEAVGEPQALAVLVGAHGCSRGLNFSNPVVREKVESVVRSEGFISVVSVDGAPEVLAATSYTVPEMYKGNKSKLEADALVKANRVLAELESVTANDPEIDYLEALRLAVSSLSQTGEMEKTIIVIGTGVDTEGEMNFKNNLFYAEPAVLAEALDQRSAIPDFHDITVIWLQMGDVAAPQEKLTSAQRKKLTEIWRAVIEKTGGTFFCEDAVSNPVEEKDYPYVTPVTLPEETPIVFDAAEVKAAENGAAALFDEPQFLSEEKVKFIADSDRYSSEAQAVEVLTPIAEYMMAHPEFRLLLIGTTAGDETTEYSRSLSKARAAAVKATLCSLGADSDRVLTLGLGSEDPWHIYGAGTGLDDPMACANRKVVLLNADSETAEELLAKGGD